VSLTLDAFLTQLLKDPRELEAYLNAAILDDDADEWLATLSTLAKAKGGLALLSKRTGIHRVHLYKMLAKGGNPSFRNVMTVLEALGVQINFSVKPSPKHAPKRRAHTKRKLAHA